MKNPVIPASGTFGFGEEFAQLYDLNLLGALSFKGTTREARYGNPLPRIAECGRYGMINAVGLQNPGVDHVLQEELPRLRNIFQGPVIANVSGFSLDDYAYTCEQLDKADGVSILEVNISCPNVHNGGMAFGTDPKAAADVTHIVKAVTHKPVYMKLSPNVTDIAAIAQSCEEAGADGICLINTMLGMRIDIHRRKPVIANRYGGYSGAGIFPIALTPVRVVVVVAVAVEEIMTAPAAGAALVHEKTCTLVVVTVNLFQKYVLAARNVDAHVGIVFHGDVTDFEALEVQVARLD